MAQTENKNSFFLLDVKISEEKKITCIKKGLTIQSILY
jgi:hypothetical protein